VAQAAEDALNLDREARRQVQRYLTSLGHDTRGVDGIFGNGTRAAIRSWQAAQGAAVTGYLNAPQLATLSAQGEVREAEIAEQERLQREAEERADRAYWQATGQGQTEQGLRDYLDRYPDGLFAETAQDRLDDFLATREDAAWQAARQTDTAAAYRGYLDDYPRGPHADQARARLEALQSGLSPQERARLEAQEAALNLQPITRSLIEQRLQRMGLEPGRVDGRFDEDTRRAIRRYQQARGLPVNGYLDQVLVVRLLAESIGGILR
jgi:peptidoglycan hydrolase-like protein with peptidoglycan-binding domain